MPRFQRSPVWRFLYSPLVVTCLFLAMLLLARSAWGVYKKEALAAERNSAAAYELANLQARQRVLSKNVAELEGQEGMEAALRAKSPIARPGEEVIVIGSQDQAARGAVASTSTKGGFWNFVNGLLKKQ